MPASASKVIGRDRELESLRQFLDAVPEGPVALLIEGEAGIGKTALWRQAIDLGRQRSYRVLACRPADSETRLSFSALDDLLAGLLDDALPALAAPKRRALEVALLRVAAVAPPPDQRAVSRAVLDVLRLLAKDSPVILAIDDAQWLDGPSARVIEFAARRLETDLIGILVSLRAQTPGGVLPLGLDRGLPEGRMYRLPLGPLSLAAIHQLVGSRLGAALPRHTLVRLYGACGGNPFFALEMAQALVRRGIPVPPEQPLPVPATLRGLVLDRLGHLSDRSRRALLRVAALSHPTVGLVRAAGGGAAAPAALDEARQAAIIEVEGERIQFTHPLLAAVLYSEASSEQRRRLHRRLAGVVADLEERARHLALGADGPDARIAVVLDEAARQAHARGAPDTAANLSEQARRLTPVGEADKARRRTVEAADHHFRAGNISQARVLLEELVNLLPLGAARAAALLRLGVVHYHQDSWPMAEGLFRQALLEGGQDPTLRAEAERELAFARQVTGDIHGAAQHARAAVEAAELTGDPLLVADSLARMVVFDFYLGRGLHAELMERAATLAASVRPESIGRGPMLDAGVLWGAMLKWSDDFAGARAKLGERYRRAAETGDESSLPFVLYQLSELLCWAGEWDRARKDAEDACRIALESEQVAVLPAALYARALVDTHLGRVDTARADAEEALALAERTHNLPVALMARSVLGLIELSLGDFEQTHMHLGPVAEAMAAMGWRSRVWSGSRPTTSRRSSRWESWRRPPQASNSWSSAANRLTVRGPLPRGHAAGGSCRLRGEILMPLTGPSSRRSWSTSACRCRSSSHARCWCTGRSGGGPGRSERRGSRCSEPWRSSSSWARRCGPTRPGPSCAGSGCDRLHRPGSPRARSGWPSWWRPGTPIVRLPMPCSSASRPWTPTCPGSTASSGSALGPSWPESSPQRAALPRPRERNDQAALNKYRNPPDSFVPLSP